MTLRQVLRSNLLHMHPCAGHVDCHSSSLSLLEIDINAVDVFLLNDDRDYANLLGALLQRHLHESTVRIFYDARSALLAASTDPPDVVISDLEMPGMNGHEFARAMRSTCATGNVLLLVACSGSVTALVSASQQRLFDHFFLKPLDVKALIQLLKEKISNIDERSD